MRRHGISKRVVGFFFPAGWSSMELLLLSIFVVVNGRSWLTLCGVLDLKIHVEHGEREMKVKDYTQITIYYYICIQV